MNARALVIAAALVVAWASAPEHALAQAASQLSAPVAPSSGQASPRGPPLDVVHLRDGGMVRGTLIESRPGQRVRIELRTGEVQEIPWSEVRSAGPDRRESAPAPAPAPPQRSGGSPVTSPGMPLRFQSEQTQLTLHLQGTSAEISVPWRMESASVHGFSRLCTAPCELELPRGTYRFGLT